MDAACDDSVETPADEPVDFRGFYEKSLKPILGDYEKKRRSATLVAYVLIAIVVIGAAGIFFSMKSTDLGGAAAIVVGAAILATFIAKFSTDGFRREFKSGVISGIARFVHPSLVYDPDGGISEATFNSTGIFKKPNRYSAEDLFRGEIGDTKIEFSEVRAEKVSGTGKSRRVERIFAGVFFAADFNKDFSGSMVVVPDRAEAMLGWVGQKIQGANLFRRGNLVSMEDAEFEERFAVYATDQQQARYILTPAFMRRLVEFRRRTGARFSLAFLNSKIFLAFPASNKWEPRLHSSVEEYNLCKSYHDDIVFFVRLVEDFNLNLRIWSKAP